MLTCAACSPNCPLRRRLSRSRRCCPGTSNPEAWQGWGRSSAYLLHRAKIPKFRWHDLRHPCASRLEEVGVPLNTVRDLLGHSSVAMSLRYAHLAPDQRPEAVAKLNEKPILALTMRLQGNHDPTAHFCPIDFTGGERGTRTLDLGIMRI